MKTSKRFLTLGSSILVLGLLLTFSSFRPTPQDEDLAGWYADGVKVDKLNCYGFKNLQLVVPYNPDWSSYTHIGINVFTESEPSVEFPGSSQIGGIKLVQVNSISSYIKGKYFVYQLFSPGDSPAKDLAAGFSHSNNQSGEPNHTMLAYELRRECLKTDRRSSAKKEGKPAPDVTMLFQIYGLTQTGSEEELYDGKIYKYPVYTSGKISRAYKLLCTNRVLSTREPEADAFYKETCNYGSTKVDFNNPGK